MEQRIIAIFCLIDEFLKKIEHKDDKRAYISSSEVLLIGYLAVSDFNENYSKAHKYIMSMKLVKNIEYSRFIIRLINWKKEVKLSNITRKKQAKLWSDTKLKGYNALKKKFFYGFKVHIIVSQQKEPISLYISEGSMHDVTASYKILSSLPGKSTAIGDKGYVSSKLEKFLSNLGINLSPIYKQKIAFN